MQSLRFIIRIGRRVNDCYYFSIRIRAVEIPAVLQNQLLNRGLLPDMQYSSLFVGQSAFRSVSLFQCLLVFSGVGRQFLSEIV